MKFTIQQQSFATPNDTPYRVRLLIVNNTRVVLYLNKRLRHAVCSIGRIIRGSQGLTLLFVI